MQTARENDVVLEVIIIGTYAVYILKTKQERGVWWDDMKRSRSDRHTEVDRAKGGNFTDTELDGDRACGCYIYREIAKCGFVGLKLPRASSWNAGSSSIYQNTYKLVV